MKTQSTHTMNTYKQDFETLMGMSQKEHNNFICSRYMGPANRFRRQEIMKEITGITIPLVKCGVNHIAEAIRKAQRAAEAKEATPTQTEPVLEVGTAVIRKKCGRKGVIKESVNGTFVIELEDGTIRKPGAHRVAKLYKFQNQ